jgi:excisionase family DNA binding protein
MILRWLLGALPHSEEVTTSMDDRLLTPREVAARLSVSVRTIYLWIETGRLDAVRLSPRCTRVPTSALEAFVASGSESVSQVAPPDQRESEASLEREPGAPPDVDLAPLLWDVDATQVDPDRHASFLIGRILTAGRPEHVAWMFRRYPREQIDQVVLADRRLPRDVSAAWRALLDIAEPQLEVVGGSR